MALPRLLEVLLPKRPRYCPSPKVGSMVYVGMKGAASGFRLGLGHRVGFMKRHRVAGCQNLDVLS